MRLSNLKDEELVELINSGSDAAWRVLEGRYRGFVLTACKQFFLQGADFQDRVSCVLISLLEAVRKYDPSVGTPFKYWAQRIIRKRVITAIKAYNRTKHGMLNNASPIVYYGEDGEIDESRDIIAPRSDPFYECCENQLREALWKSIAELLSPFEADVLVYLRQGMSYTEIAKVLQADNKAVDNAIGRIRKKARGSHLCNTNAQYFMEVM